MRISRDNGNVTIRCSEEDFRIIAGALRYVIYLDDEMDSRKDEISQMFDNVLKESQNILEDDNEQTHLHDNRQT